MTTNPDKILEHDEKAVGTADHCLVYCVSSFKSQSPTQCHRTIELHNFKVFNINDFLLDLEQCPWTSVEEFEDVDQAYQVWKNLLTQVCDKHFPFATRHVRKNILSWLTGDIKEDIKMKHYFCLKKAHTKRLQIYWQCSGILETVYQTH